MSIWGCDKPAKKVSSSSFADLRISHTSGVPSTNKPVLLTDTSVQEIPTNTSLTVYRMQPDIGHIGIHPFTNSDKPSDNIFEVRLGMIPAHSRIWLVYQLYGVSDAWGVSKSINDRTVTGGYFTTLTNHWTTVREELHPSSLKEGLNSILFTIAPDAAYGYSVRDVRIEMETGVEQLECMQLCHSPIGHQSQIYVHGFVRGRADSVRVGTASLPIHEGTFEGFIPMQDDRVTLFSVIDGKARQKTFRVKSVGEITHVHPFTARGNTVRKSFMAHQGDSMQLSGTRLNIIPEAISKKGDFSITALRDYDIPTLNLGMTNVTAQDGGYRFLPHGVHFVGKGAQVELAYDPLKIPSGYTQDDIRTYYFDTERKEWVALERVKVDAKRQCVVSVTTHFTDMINGVIKAPESPQTDGFTPTMMNDIKAADPTAKINLITPPTANNRGSANLQYVFEMPPARNGMAPTLGIQYSSEGGSGWLGEGWNLPVPSITLDTRWGVPRYDTGKETETYLLSGSMLSTMGNDGKMSVAHRGEKIDRKADRQFYNRQGGDFSRIIRKGTSPANYTWEVTDKQGVRYIYGGEGAVLKGTVTDAGGNSREIISEWKLKRVEETHGDYIEYVYETADEPVRGGLIAKAIYLKEVHAGNSGQTPHTVVVFENSKLKRIKSNNARYGFLTSSNRLLGKLVVKFQGSILRSYTFVYDDDAFNKDGLTKVVQSDHASAFNKDVLIKVVQSDDAGAEVSYQNFYYYNDVQSDKGYVPFKDNQEKWNTHSDDLSAGFVNPMKKDSKRFSDKPTALGGIIGSSFSGSFYAGVGVVDGSPWKGNTVGGSYSYSKDNSKGLSTLVDLNGDGLPDKVYKSGGKLYYRPQIVTNNGQRIYGEPIRVVGITNFSTVHSTTNAGGGKAVVGWMDLTAEIGKDFSKTKTETSEYFSDVNGDGLVDLVSNRKVYFNHIEFDAAGNAVPTFTLSSADTPSPIIYSGKIDKSVITIDPEEQKEMIASSPMQDMVRLWQAPKDGVVNISGNVSLIAPSGEYDPSEYDKADGVRVAIQKGSNELWNKVIAKGDNTSYSADANNIMVKRGDRIYFRLQSGTTETSTGYFDNVRWSPVVNYVGDDEVGPNGMSSNVYKSSEAAVYDVNTQVNVDSANVVFLSGKFSKPITTDDIVLKAFASNEEKDSLGNENPSYRKIEVYTRTFKHDEAFDGELTDTINTDASLSNLQFLITSTSNVDWKSVQWKPILSYGDGDERKILSGAVHYVMFPNMVNDGKSITTTSSSLTVIPSVVFSEPSNVNGSLTLTIKTTDKLLEKKTYTVVNGILPPDTLVLNDVDSLKIWMDYFFNGNLEENVSVTSVANVPGLGNIAAGFYKYDVNKGFGLLYRGWGGFVYNAGDGRYAKPIDESLLRLPEDKGAKIDPQSMAFTPIGTDQINLSHWIGQNEYIYLTAEEMSAARLAHQDVVLTNPLDGDTDMDIISGDCLEGTGAIGITQVATNKSSVTLSGALGITYSDASGTAKTKVTTMDMNGDGYPDILAGGTIQYTNTQGGLSGEKYENIGLTISDNSSYAWGYGGDPVASVSQISKVIREGAKAIQNVQTGWQANFSISGSNPHNTDEAVETFIDINGDGLPDKILKDKAVRINLGYRFSEPIQWNIERIQGGKSIAYNAGASGGAGGNIGSLTEYKGTQIHKASGSIMGGFGLVTSEADEKFNLIDVNSDGLADMVWKEQENVSGLPFPKDIVKVRLNIGNGFTNEMVWNGLSSLSENLSTAESVNGAFTFSVNIPVISIKISTNPSISTGHSINRPTYSLQDVDGDGYLDIVESDKENELKVTRSAIGRTNLLKSVTNSLGGTFTLDYEHSAPTYGLPGGKWVMSSVTVDDGIHDDGPMMKTLYAYSDGRKDRHEREFLGFGKVITQNIDTEKGEDAVYRQLVQFYDVSSYYTQGNLLGSYVADAAGNKYSETRNEYDGYYLTANGDKYTFTKQTKLCSDHASAFVPLRYTSNRQYEGKTSSITTSEAWNEYYLTGYRGELKSYRFSDKGTLGPDGSGRFDYQTTIQYAQNDNKHIFGLPTNITVTGGDGKTYRQVSATYDMNHADHITQIRQQLGSGEAVSDYTYDTYGNITKTTLPANAKGQRMWYTYLYEPVMNMYVERVEDAFGYRSEAYNFDYRYGMALRRMDLNHFYYETDIDNLGRVIAVRGPNELATGVPYIIAFDYQPKAAFGKNGITAPAYAVTRHHDIQHPNDDMETVTLVDGFGRPVQVKKDGVVTTAAKGSVPKDENVMIVSGRNVYDAFGRVAKAYYPVTEALGGKTAFNRTFDDVSPTVTVYDVLDRAMKVTLPDNTETRTEYTTDAGSNTLVATVTDALGNRQATYTDGSGKTVRTEQLSGPDGTITTSFEYDGIDRLVKVTDTEGNVTTSVYDMGDRRTEVNHPASGITTFTYDNLGNVLTKQTANLRKEGKAISYEYDYGRLTAINYPDHPENNVRYHYGGRNASHNRIGRLMLREDGSGAVEYYYGKMGEVTKTVRTMIVPNQAIATYVTQWRYDSHNRLLEMTYPDGERISYGYDLGGQLYKVTGEHFHRYDYVRRLGYDKFGQRIYMQYCNGTETSYGYNPSNRRMDWILVKGKDKGKDPILIRNYRYDGVGNITAFNGTNSTFRYPTMHGSYEYDNLYRLVYSSGSYYAPYDSKEARYELLMAYDNMHRIRWKKQDGYQGNFQFEGKVSAGYELRYAYHEEPGRTFQLSGVQDDNYRSREEADDALRLNHRHGYEYDANGNLVHINTARVKKDGAADAHSGQRRYRWDEENRLLAASDGGYVSHYLYDADGERTVKTSGDNGAVYVNSGFSGGNTGTTRFTLYVSPYYVASPGGRYTKHVYIGGQRVVSKLGQLERGNVDPRITAKAGGEAPGVSVDYAGKYAQQLEALKDNYRNFDLPYNGADNTDPGEGRGFCCDGGRKGASGMRAAADNFHEADAYQRLQFYYHSDHLGNSTYITNLDAEVTQHIEYVPFGEVFIEERNNTWNTPYLFNAKELDEETGLYYYGARYYDPRLSLWMSTDPMEEKYPNINSYCFSLNNPIKIIDPNGMDSYLIIWASQPNAYGHAAFGVDNYVWSKNQNKYIPDGTITVFGLFPISSYSPEQASHDERVRGSFLIDANVTLKELKANDFYSGESNQPDGILKISSGYQTDKKAKEVLQKEIKSSKGYRGMSRNCSTYAREGVKSALGEEVKGEESFLGKTYVTPNRLFKDTKILPNTEILVDPGKKTDYEFSTAIKATIKEMIKSEINK